MKYLIVISLLFLSFNLFSVEVLPPPPEKKDLADMIKDISWLMANLEDKLREDRHDETVQWEGKRIEEEIEKLLKKTEEYEANENKKSKGPKEDSDLPKSKFQEIITREIMPWERLGYYNWAKLSEVEKTKIIQNYAQEVPLRWKKRIAAYFLSIDIAEEEGIKFKEDKIEARDKFLKELIKSINKDEKLEPLIKKIDK